MSESSYENGCIKVARGLNKLYWYRQLHTEQLEDDGFLGEFTPYHG